MKKLLALLLTLLMVFSLFAGCKKKENEEVTSSDDTAFNESIEEGDADDTSSEEDGDEDADSDTPGAEDGDEEDDDEGTDNTSSENPENSETSSEKPETSETSSEKPESSKTSSNNSEPFFENLKNNTERSPEAVRAELIKAGEDKEFNDSGYVYDGNLARLANVLRKGKSGQAVKIVAYGGVNSIDSRHASVNYCDVLQSWCKANLSQNSEVVSVGGETMTSEMAVMMLENEVLSKNPDIVILDFSVQDAFKSASKVNSIAFDNMVRRILKANPNTAIINLMMTGATQESYTANRANIVEISTTGAYQLEICKYYQIPVIDFGTAFDDISSTLVEVTPKKEFPVLLWESISSNNISLSDVGQTMLGAMVSGYFDKTLSALSSLPTVGNAIPVVGYFADDSYMESSFANVLQIAEESEGHIPGYSYDITLKKYAEYGYKQEDSNKNYLRTYRHYVPEDPNNATQMETSTGTPYMIINIPEVSVTTKRYFVMGLTSDITFAYLPSPVTFHPLTIISYDKNGNKIGSVQAEKGVLSEATACYGLQSLPIPYNATKIEIRAYCTGGGIDLYGIGTIK